MGTFEEIAPEISLEHQSSIYSYLTNLYQASFNSVCHHHFVISHQANYDTPHRSKTIEECRHIRGMPGLNTQPSSDIYGILYSSISKEAVL
jgi:hypothetical protein